MHFVDKRLKLNADGWFLWNVCRPVDDDEYTRHAEHDAADAGQPADDAESHVIATHAEYDAADGGQSTAHAAGQSTTLAGPDAARDSCHAAGQLSLQGSAYTADV